MRFVLFLIAMSTAPSCGTRAPEALDDTAAESDSSDTGSAYDPVVLLPRSTGDVDTGDTGAPSDVLTDVEAILDPYDRSRLTAIIKVRHPALSPESVERVRITVKGQGDDPENLVADLLPKSAAYRTCFDLSDQLDEGEVGVPVLGLYPGVANEVSFELDTGDRRLTGEAVIETAALPGEERSSVAVYVPERMEPGWVWNANRVYDNRGNLRWYGNTAYEHLDNGNLLVGVDERNLLGKTVIDRTLPGHLAFHHDAISLPNGNVVACVSNAETEVITAEGETVESVEDYIVELDHDTGDIVNAWDLRQYLDVDRQTWCNLGRDWFHANTLAYDPQDDSIVVSGRCQGIVKLTRGGIRGPEANLGKALAWVLAPHMGWGESGFDGSGSVSPGTRLLTAVDPEGAPYDSVIQQNLEAPSPDPEAFAWPLGHHGLQITAAGDGTLSLLVFSNQASFLFDGPDSIDNGVFSTSHGDLGNDRPGGPYSQIIEYEIDERAMTVRKLWSYGEGLPALYGSLRSGVAYLRGTGNRLMMSNGFDQTDRADNPYNPHFVEVTEDGEVVFHLQIEDARYSLYQGGKIDLYHPER